MAIVKLSKPVRGVKGMVTELPFRDPVYGDYMELGEPGNWVETVAGAGFFQESPAVINQYARLLCVEDPNLLDTLPLRDTLAIRDTILGFFKAARESASPPSAALPAGSSSGADSAQATSTG